MGSDESVTVLDFTGTIKPWVRLLYDQIVIVSIVSLLGVLLMFPVVTIGPVVLAAMVTVQYSVAHRDGETAVSERELTRLFLGSIRTHFRRGLVFSGAIVVSIVVLGVYLTLAFASDSPVFWLGTAFGFYTLLAVMLLTFRTGHVLARSDETPTTIDAVLDGIAIAKRAPGYSAMQYLFAGLVITVLVVLPIFGMVLLLGSIALLEIAVYETIEGGEVNSLLE